MTGGTSSWEDQLSEALRTTGLSKSEFARRAKVSYRTVARWGAGVHRPRQDSRERVAAVDDAFAVLMAALPEGRSGTGDVASRAALTADLQALGVQVERLADTLTRLVEAQRPALRDQLRRALAGESP